MACLVCGSSNLTVHLDVGEHPVASFFLESSAQKEEKHSLVVGQCENCGTVQLIEPVPYDALVPPYFLLAREPEEHLDDAVENIISEGTLDSNSVIGGLTYKDDTTLSRFQRKGFKKTWRLELENDFKIENPAANIETIQKLVTQQRMAAIAKNHPPADLLIVRHITEHTEDLKSFMEGLAELVAPKGLLMLEIPDCSTSLQLKEYCMIWEEHSLYFTPETFKLVPTIGGFENVWLKVYERPFENTIVLLARKKGNPKLPVVTKRDEEQFEIVKEYGVRYEESRIQLRKKLEAFKKEKGKIAIFGAGHLAHAFINFMNVADLIEFIADDTPEKQEKYLPGTGLKILPSSELVNKEIKLCLLALSIPSEPNVIGKNEKFVAAGGEFRSILRASPRSIVTP